MICPAAASSSSSSSSELPIKRRKSALSSSEIPIKRRKSALSSSELHTKRRKSALNEQNLLPGLPDDLAQLCLSPLHPSLLYSVCRSWRRLIYSPSFPSFLSLYALFLPSQSQTHLPDSIHFLSFDPISSSWHPLPPPPPDPPLRPILRHPSFLSRDLPVQSLSISGKLVLLAATADPFLPALPRPLVFDPLCQKWAFGPPLDSPRRWCAAGASGGAVYVASGIGTHYNSDVARSVEKWDLQNNRQRNNRRNAANRWFELGWKWEKMGALRHEKFCRDAIDAVGWRGKLCMVNVKGDAAKEGVVYDVEGDEWAKMPEGMVGGWRGPAAAMDEETLYVVDESKGVLRKYDSDNDRWEEVLGAEERLRGAKRMAAAGGRVCVVCEGGSGIVVVDVAASPARLWVVDTPEGLEAVAVHILPRMSH